jgi:putative PEP-CTERM system histidine kinase
MALLGLEAVVSGIAVIPPSGNAFPWQLDHLVLLSLLPGVWLVFSMIFGRNDYHKILLQRKWPLLAATFIPPCLALFFRESLFDSWSDMGTSSLVSLRLGWSGYALFLLCLVAFVLILMNLERVFRNATGHSRWQIKFMVLGLFVVFGVRVFTGSQAVLFRSVNVSLEALNPAALLLGCALIARSITRSNPLEFHLYLSHSAIYNSFTVLIVGVYFIVIGVAAKAAFVFYGSGSIPIVGFIVLVAVLGLAVFFLSDRVRFRRKQFVSHHFKRPAYDYQKVWAGFTENTASITSARDLCLAVTTLVSHTLDVLSVSLWLVDENQERVQLGSSTMLSENQAKNSGMYREAGKMLLSLMSDKSMPVDLWASHDEPFAQLMRAFKDDFEAAEVRYCVPLRAAGTFVGIMTLGKRVMDYTMSFADYELLRTLGDQSAAALLNLKLSEKLRQAKELEALQVMSAFFLHDLKNLASKLSLVGRNMPKHYDNEEFREDAIHTVSQSVDKIKGMCTRLSLLNQTLGMDPQTLKVRELVIPTLAGLHGIIGSTVKADIPDDLPAITADEEQMRKVLENLIINANEATSGTGNIEIAALCHNGRIEISVSDNGVGIAPEFIEKSLFKPFQTTKKQGMGIGLFHCKTIVEAHGGRIEVESEEGKGTTFRVILPAKG